MATKILIPVAVVVAVCAVDRVEVECTFDRDKK
jgi:hypothetical protein